MTKHIWDTHRDVCVVCKLPRIDIVNLNVEECHARTQDRTKEEPVSLRALRASDRMT